MGNQEADTALGRCRSAVVADCAAFKGLNPLPSVELDETEDLAELLTTEHRLVEDHLGYPLLFPICRGRQDFDAVARFLDRLDVCDEHRCYLEWAALETAAQFEEHQWILDRGPQVEARVEQLGSQTLRRRLSGTHALALELSGELEAAADRIEPLIDELPTALHHTDVLHTLRRTRILVLAGRPVSGADVRRPWEWIDANPGIRSALISLLLNTAVVADSFGQSALARRLILQVRPAIRKEAPASMFGDVSPELRAAIGSDEMAAEPLEAVEADVFRFAATL